MSSTLPIWIPRYLTFASLSITKPARGDVTVTVSVGVNAAVYAKYVNTVNTTRIAANTAAAILIAVVLDTTFPLYPDRLKLPDAPYTARAMNKVMTTTTISDVRTACPTAMPTPTGPPEAL